LALQAISKVGGTQISSKNRTSSNFWIILLADFQSINSIILWRSKISKENFLKESAFLNFLISFKISLEDGHKNSLLG
jgi:hypothetical protein